MNKLIYLDNNATTKVDEKVLEEMMPYFKEEYANPSSMYDFSKKSSKAIKEARGKLKDFFNAADEKEIIFTSCGSESANTAIRGVLASDKTKKHIITTQIEHPCVLNVYKYLEKQGYNVDYIGVNSNGELNLDQLRNAIKDDTALVSVMWANNETGVLNPIGEISQIIKSKNPNTKFFVDGVQAAGKVPIDVQEAGVDMVGISGHKLHAPPYIVGHGKAAELAIDNMEYELTEVKRLRDKLEKGIIHNIYNARVNTGLAQRVPNTTNIGFEYIEGELILLHLSDLGICASSGSACTSGSLEPSHVLRAMNVPFTAIHGSIRWSLSRFTTEDEIDYVIEKLPKVIEEITAISPYQAELKALKELKLSRSI